MKVLFQEHFADIGYQLQASLRACMQWALPILHPGHHLAFQVVNDRSAGNRKQDSEEQGHDELQELDGENTLEELAPDIISQDYGAVHMLAPILELSTC